MTRSGLLIFRVLAFVFAFGVGDAVALAFAGDGLYEVGANTIQVHGGVGYTWEHDAHLFYKRLLTLQGLGGGSADQLEELATLIL